MDSKFNVRQDDQISNVPMNKELPNLNSCEVTNSNAFIRTANVKESGLVLLAEVFKEVGIIFEFHLSPKFVFFNAQLDVGINKNSGVR